VSSVPGRRHLRSTDRGELSYPSVNLSTYEGRAFAYAGPTTWSSLPDDLKNINLSLLAFKATLRPLYFPTSTLSPFDVFYINAR